MRAVIVLAFVFPAMIAASGRKDEQKFACNNSWSVIQKLPGALARAIIFPISDL
jgi:hypothetical protein